MSWAQCSELGGPTNTWSVQTPLGGIGWFIVPTFTARAWTGTMQLPLPPKTRMHRPDANSAPTSDLLLGAQSESILYRISLLAMVATVVVSWTIVDSLWPVTIDNATTYAVLLIGCTTWWLTSRGWGRMAAFWLTSCMLLTEVVNATQVSGLRTPGLLVILPTTVTVAAWLGGTRAALGTATVGMVSTLGLLAAEHWGLVHPVTQRSVLTYGTALFFGILVTAAVQYASLRAYHLQLVAMRNEQARNEALFHDNPVPISTLDADGRFVDVNEAWLRTFHRSRDAVLGHTSAELGLWCNPSERAEFMALMQSHDTVMAYPAWLHTPGAAALFHIHAARILLGSERHFAITLLDQSDRLAAETAHRQVQEQLESRVAERTAELRATITALESTQAALVQSEKLASLGSLVAGVAHELNTPVGTNLTLATTVQQHVADLQHKAAHDSLRKSDLNNFLRTQGEMAELLVRNAQRSADLISSFKQVAVDRTSERQRTFDLHDLALDTQRSLQPSLRHLRLHFSLDIAQGIHCDGYPGAVGQILTNLIQNAAIHAFAADSAGHICIRAHTTPEHRVVLEVQDDGCGMDAATAHRVFDPFFTTRLGQGGSGLGLSVAYNLATGTLQGALGVRSTPGQGSCFRLEFPQHLPAASADTLWHPAL